MRHDKREEGFMSLRKPYAIGITVAAIVGISGLTAVGVSYADEPSRGTAVYFADNERLCNQIGDRLVRAGEIRSFECVAKVGLVDVQAPAALPPLFDSQRECQASIRNPRLQQCVDGFAV